MDDRQFSTAAFHRKREEARLLIAEGAAEVGGCFPDHFTLLAAGMPQWMAAAAMEEMRAEAGLYGADSEMSKTWWMFVKRYAASGIEKGGFL